MTILSLANGSWLAPIHEITMFKSPKDFILYFGELEL